MSEPLEYFERYFNLSIPNPAGGADIAASISVKNYLLGLKDKQTNARVSLLKKLQKDFAKGKKDNPDYKIKVRVSTESGYQEREFSGITSQDEDPLWRLIRYPYAGKGSPDGIQAALQLAATDGPSEKALISPDKIQSYCDDLLGVDCNGFVGGYLRHEWQMVDWWNLSNSNSNVSPSDLIVSIWNKIGGEVRTKAADIDPSDTNLLVLVDSKGNVIPGGKPPHGHIAISQPGESTSTLWQNDVLGKSIKGTNVPAICVLESTAAIKSTDGTSGLARSWYHYVDDPVLKNRGVMLMSRGVNGKTIRMKVKALR